MQYVSLDIETNGIDHQKDLVLEIGAVFEDSNVVKPLDELDVFHCYIIHSEEDIMRGNEYAIDLNKETIERILNREKYEGDYLFLKPNQVADVFFNWMKLLGWNETFVYSGVEGLKQITFAGKNFAGFDKRFLDELPQWNQRIKHVHRILDPTSIFVDWKNDKVPPTLDQCKERANVEGVVTHDALDDALDVVQVLRSTYAR